MGIINVLSPQMANLIAAGEVVERPGSVVKELIENAVDAGSTRIEVEIQNGGVTRIRVTDNGCGIEREDAAKAFLRHATSKIKEPDDMAHIATMGFRGEAIAAISAVSRVDLFTRTEKDLCGTHIVCEGGEVGEPADTGFPGGTTIIIRDLFYNVPARMKFLKKDSTEASYCESAVTSAALAHPEISFKFIKDGRESFFTSGSGELLRVITALCGAETAKGLVPLRGVLNEVEITGYVSDVGTTRSSRSMQYFLVNGRPVRGKILSAAVDGAYKGRIMPGRFPIVFLDIKLPYSLVDVNVHPAKLEVKFAREKDVFSAIHNTIDIALNAEKGFPEMELVSAKPTPVPREDNVTEFQQQITVTLTKDGHLVMDEAVADMTAALASPSVSGTSEKDEDDGFDESMFKINKLELMPTRRPRRVEPPEPPVEIEAYVPTGAEPESVEPVEPNAVSEAVEEAAPDELTPEEPVEQKIPVAEIVSASEASEADAITGTIRVAGELFDTYIIVQQDDTMWLIDKHAAHERMIYNRMVAKSGDQDMQTLLTPVAVTLTAPEKQACLDNLSLLEKSGFELEDYGLGGLTVRSAPVYLETDDIPFVISDMAQRLMDGDTAESAVLDELLKSISCKAAVKGGSYSSPEEKQHLAEQVLTRDDLKNCPHGRPVAISMSRYQLEKQFKRVL